MPFDFETNVGDIPQTVGTSKYPPNVTCGYKGIIKYSKIGKNAKNNDTWELRIDISDGPFTGCFKDKPRRFWQNLSTPAGKNIAKKIIERIVKEPDNIGLVNADSILSSKTFDESSLVGCKCGIILTPEKGFLNISNICSIDYALQFKPKEVPEETKKPDKQTDQPF